MKTLAGIDSLFTTRDKTRMTRLALLVGALSLCTITPAFSDATCEARPIAMSMSPDDKWIAVVREGLCTAGSVSVSTNTVEIVPRDAMSNLSLLPSSGQPEHEGDVLAVDYYGHFQSRPVLRWLSPQSLQIAIPNISGVGLSKPNYRGVQIVVKYKPDDPAAREKWVKEHGLAR
jgi:hypothetical protein